MKESDVQGLAELRKEYNEKLRQLPGYDDLHTMLRIRALELVRQEVARQGLCAPISALPSPDLRGSCGFCEDCITDCVGCTLYN